MDETIIEATLLANKRLATSGLVTLTWGNASGFDAKTKLMAIKPSGVDYGTLRAEDLVILDLDGTVVRGTLRPSSDTDTHLELYRRFHGIGGIVHTHSTAATTLCQMGRALPVFGTTHADHFAGPVPLIPTLPAEAVDERYEHNTGVAIADHFSGVGLDPIATPAALLQHHAPFVWGKTVAAALDNAVALEVCAQMALAGWQAGVAEPMPEHLTRHHQARKHGPNATYGQVEKA
ncbi:MAG: L-ribulose-5-phosphate 4-epimerase AraD [Pseudomonadota bacterium]